MTVRAPVDLDNRAIARLITAIVEKGGTTALTRPIAAADIAEWRAFDPDRAAWRVALDGSEEVQGVQWIEPRSDLPPEACDIATFVASGRQGLGIGSALFSAISDAAYRLSYRWINAAIRADNKGGLIFYQSRGFRPYDRIEDVALQNGVRVDKVLMRYDLDGPRGGIGSWHR